MIDFIKTIYPGRIVALGINDEGKNNLNSNGYEALYSLGN